MDAAVPIWMRTRRGQLIELDADELNRRLYAASERAGAADPFLAREITDGVLFLLQRELGGEPLPESDFPNILAKLVRELGQPSLAELLEPEAAAEIEPSSNPFPRDLLSLHSDGLLRIHGIEQPNLIEAARIGFDGSLKSLQHQLDSAQRFVGRLLILDGPDYLLAAQDGSPAELARRAAELLAKSTRLRVLANLNAPQPPLEARQMAEGPLFAQLTDSIDRTRQRELAGHLAFALSQSPTSVRWYGLSPGIDAEFVLDDSSDVLGYGVTRRNPGALQRVDLDVQRLAGQFSEGSDALMLAKMATLARLAVRVGHAKLSYLRQVMDKTTMPPFFLDRTRLVVAPIGLSQLLSHRFGAEAFEHANSIALARSIFSCLTEALIGKSRSNLEVCLDATIDLPCELKPTRALLRSLHSMLQPARGGGVVAPGSWSPKSAPECDEFRAMLTGCSQIKWLRFGDAES